jgi:hypothetical protein
VQKRKGKSGVSPRLRVPRFPCAKLLRGMEVQNRIAAFSIALENLLAEFHAHLLVRAPGRGAQAKGSFAIKPQKKRQGQILGARQFQSRAILGDFANLADQVFIKRGMGNRSLHKDSAPPGAPLLKFNRILCHGFTYPQPVMPQVKRASVKLALSIPVKLLELMTGGKWPRPAI